MYDVSSEDRVPIWARPAPGERRPAHTRERIAAVALQIADREGYEAVTMRRVAAELGAGTMTLYHYVRNKEELSALMDDSIMGELLVPEDELADDWREGLAEIARRSYAAFQRHPWIFDHFAAEESLAVAARTGLDIAGQFELVALVDDFVFGHAMRSRSTRVHESRHGAQERLEGLIAYLKAQLDTGQFPHLTAFAGADAAAGFERVMELAGDPGRFERGLQRLLDGIALDLDRRR